MAVGYFIRMGDKTTCGGTVLEGDSDCTMHGVPQARQGDKVSCGKDGKVYQILGGVHYFRSGGIPVAGSLDSYSSCPCQARLVPSLFDDTYRDDSDSPASQRSAAPGTAPQRASISPLANPAAASSGNAAASCPVPPKPPAPEPLRLPARIFLSQGKMDDYAAPDMKHGDLDAKELKRRYDWAPNYISEIAEPSRLKRWLNSFKVDTLTREEQRKADAQELFEDFHQLAATFSWYGPYRSLIDLLIDHMQGNTGAPFRHPLMDQALSEHKSMSSSLEAISNSLSRNIDWKHGYYPAVEKEALTRVVLGSYLPKFDSWINRIDGMGLAVHDTAATEIVLKSLFVRGNQFRAEVHYRIQDHFGLDDKDVAHPLYGSLPLFQIWYVLQRWSGYGFQPFLTEMSVIKTVDGIRSQS
ncbi:PAAR domain-containing protein [Pseudomonas knackmussii]|uniref:PAAR domain-containing protein n=1 Tax=Pseudomonas knackmussii TaxID=65741 RepID=UPI003F4A410D